MNYKTTLAYLFIVMARCLLQDVLLPFEFASRKMFLSWDENNKLKNARPHMAALTLLNLNKAVQIALPKGLVDEYALTRNLPATAIALI